MTVTVNEPRREQRLARGPSPLMYEAWGAPRVTSDLAGFPRHLAAHRAQAVMLRECGIISVPDAAALLRVLDELERGGVDSMALDPQAADLFSSTELHLRRELGDAVGGRLHTGRSRNDLFMALERMADRELILSITGALLDAQQTIYREAERHVDTLFPGYTHHSQIAQPITFGHFLLGHADALGRSVERLSGAYARTNLSPLGAAAFAGTGFPIDRERLAELLGFDGLIEHTADAAGSRDFQLEIASALAIIGSTLSVFAESLILYTTREFGYIELADEFADPSSIMPQKKNPVGLEMVEGFAAKATGHLTTMLTALKSTTMGSSREAAFCNGELAAMGKEIGWALRLTEAIVGSLRVVEDRARIPLIEGFATATEVADALVRTRQLSFRQAHNVVGRVVRSLAEGPRGGQMTAEALNAAARELLELDLHLADAELADWLEPMASVEIRATRGGPAPREVRRMLRERATTGARARAELDARQVALHKADALLRETARRLTESAA